MNGMQFWAFIALAAFFTIAIGVWHSDREKLRELQDRLDAREAAQEIEDDVEALDDDALGDELRRVLGPR